MAPNSRNTVLEAGIKVSSVPCLLSQRSEQGSFPEFSDFWCLPAPLDTFSVVEASLHAQGHLLSMVSQSRPSVLSHVPVSPFHKGTKHVELGTPYGPPLNLMLSIKTVSKFKMYLWIKDKFKWSNFHILMRRIQKLSGHTSVAKN